MALRIAPDSRLNAAPHVLAKASSALADRPGTKLCEIPKAPLAIAMPINANIRSAVAQREKESCPSMAMKCSPCPGEPVCGRFRQGREKRPKIAASNKKGMWMGGAAPLNHFGPRIAADLSTGKKWLAVLGNCSKGTAGRF